MHRQATGLKPEQDYDLTRKVEFLKRIRRTQIANKIIKSTKFKDYTRYSLQSCFARALELEGDFMVEEVVNPNYTQTQVLPVEGEDDIELDPADPGDDQGGTLVQPLRVPTTQMYAIDVVNWDTSQENAHNQIYDPQKLEGKCIIVWRQIPQ